MGQLFRAKAVPLSKHPLITLIIHQGWISLEKQYFIDLSLKSWEKFRRANPRWEMHFPLAMYGKREIFGSLNLETARIVQVCHKELAEKILSEVEDAYLIVNDLVAPSGEKRIKFDAFAPKISSYLEDEKVVYKIYFESGEHIEVKQPKNYEQIFDPSKTAFIYEFDPPQKKEHLPFFENAKRFYEEGVLRCPKCGSFRVTGEGTEERPYWCWACGYMWTKELFEPEVVRKAEKKERELYAKMLAETLMYPFLKWEAERHGFTGPEAVKRYLKWREEEDWRRNQFYGFYVSEGDQDYIERIVESYMEEPESYRGLDAIDAVLMEYGYDFADYRPHKGYIWNPLNKKWMLPPYPPRTGDEVLALPKYKRMFPTHNYMFDRAIVKAVLLRRGWKFGIKGWQKG